LTTTGWKTGKQHTVEIWFVEYDQRYYIMSERQSKAHWVQNIIHNPNVLFTLYNGTFKGNARIVDQEKDPKLATQVSKLMGAKYRWNNGLIVEISKTAEIY
jgi:deazaflavin-dependent oxidoreductase (nitroreductase family)